jgi:hypothetical protein
VTTLPPVNDELGWGCVDGRGHRMRLVLEIGDERLYECSRCPATGTVKKPVIAAPVVPMFGPVPSFVVKKGSVGPPPPATLITEKGPSRKRPVRWFGMRPSDVLLAVAVVAILVVFFLVLPDLHGYGPR